ncbi:MAG: NAD(P)H-hydrate dehydratase [Eubacteriales bacterium]|nr:NAD(P)H-hydrate dehydratase [Eubacteriales bacterium]
MERAYLLTGQEMAEADRFTSEEIGIPSLVLMERAALAVAEAIRERFPEPVPVAVLAGRGNNGADGLAVARLLSEAGYPVRVFLLPGEIREGSALERQRRILERLGVGTEIFAEETQEQDVGTGAERAAGKTAERRKERQIGADSMFRTGREAAVIVDALFGTGLGRPLTGAALAAVRAINQARRGSGESAFLCKRGDSAAVSGGTPVVFAVDLPSGISADDGSVQGEAVQADVTVTFGFYKRGQMLYPGASCCGELRLADIGIGSHSLQGEPPLFTLLPETGKRTETFLPPRDPDGNKGTFGKVLLIAGSRNMAGAAILAGRACMLAGAGMVRIMTPECNRIIVQTALPEALLTTYETVSMEPFSVESASMESASMETVPRGSDVLQRSASHGAALPARTREELEAAMRWADAVAVGPGLGRSPEAAALLREVLMNLQRESVYRLVLDADALRLLAMDPELGRLLRERDESVLCVMTPHMGEAAALAGREIVDCRRDRFALARELAEKYRACMVCKDARTVVCSWERGQQYLNTSGNSGMATAGSGDVLTGMTAALSCRCEGAFETAVAAVYLHGISGDLAAERLGEEGVTAQAIAQEIPAAIRRLGG